MGLKDLLGVAAVVGLASVASKNKKRSSISSSYNTTGKNMRANQPTIRYVAECRYCGKRNGELFREMPRRTPHMYGTCPNSYSGAHNPHWVQC